MKKLSKFAAVVAAMALLMAMSTSAFAAVNESASEDDGIFSQEITATAGDQEGVIIADDEEAIPALSDAEAQAKVEQLLGITVPDDQEIIVIDSANLKFKAEGELSAEHVLKGTAVTFTLDVGYAEGTTVYVLHQKSDGTWEAKQYTVDENGEISVTLDGLSPVYLALLAQKGVIEDPTTPNTPNNTDKPADKPAANTTKVSPKTGF